MHITIRTLLSFILLILSHRSYAQQKIAASRLEADTMRSVIRWKGTKMMGTAQHEGTVSLKKGYLTLQGSEITSGHFIVDINDIKITDIPSYDRVPSQNLTNHLRADFETRKFPESTFVVHPGGTLRNICGDLTIKGVTRSTCVTASGTVTHFLLSFVIKRSDYSIGEKGSWLEQRLVDDEIFLDMDVYMR